MMRQTGGSAVGWISTRSMPDSSASASASSRDSTPTISPSAPITRTRGTRISLFLRLPFSVAGVLIRQSSFVFRNPVASGDRGGLVAQLCGESFRRDCAQIFAAARAHGNQAQFLLAVTDDQQVRDFLHRVLADFIADLLVPQIGGDPETLIYKGFLHESDMI